MVFLTKWFLFAKMLYHGVLHQVIHTAKRIYGGIHDQVIPTCQKGVWCCYWPSDSYLPKVRMIMFLIKWLLFAKRMYDAIRGKVIYIYHKDARWRSCPSDSYLLKRTYGSILDQVIPICLVVGVPNPRVYAHA